jgi:FkbM family methyltransferase
MKTRAAMATSPRKPKDIHMSDAVKTRPRRRRFEAPALWVLNLAISILKALLGAGWMRYVSARRRSSPVFLAQRGETVVLGGVYVEATVRRWLDAVGRRGKLIIIEANPASILALQEKLGVRDNVILVSQGIWSEKGSLSFVVSDGEYQGWARLDHPDIGEYPRDLDPGAREIEIEVDTLDNILSRVGVQKVDLVNLTINDAHLQALDGVERLLANNPNVRFYILSRTPSPGDETVVKLKALGMKVISRTLEKEYHRPDVECVGIYAYRR